MNYVSRYGLEFNHFIKNSKKILYENNNYKEVKVRLDYLLQTKGIGLITGDPGCGKTTIVRNYTNNLNQNAYKIIYLPLSTLTVLEAYKQLAIAFNIEPFHRKYENFAAIQDAI
ncbi:ATP-binding protein, partial [Bullifex sp.]|uniref:ATP-binding protein n=1 Tax=Bullifex sp. TaxID=2815808 RepID=UPI002A81B17C